MEEKDLRGRVEQLEKIVRELTQVVYAHAIALASLRREFSVHYHVHEGKTLPKTLRTGDPLFAEVTRVSPPGYDVKPLIEEFERDPQAFLRNSNSDLFYWPWE